MKRLFKGNVMMLVLCLTLFLGCGAVYAAEIGTQQATEIAGESESETESETMSEAQTEMEEKKDTDGVNRVNSLGTTLEEGQSNPEIINSEPEPETETDVPMQGWIETETGKMYYVDNQPVVGERRIDGAWYYFNESGIMATGITVQTDRPDKVYYYDEDGKMHYGWKELDGKQYYFHPTLGVMLKGAERNIDGVWYYFNEDGVMATGWTSHHNHTYYYQNDGHMTYGEKYIDGYWYYFHEKTGVMATGWSKHHNHTYYYQNDGHMTYGEKYIDGYWYYFHERTGVMATGWAKHHDHTYYYQSNGHMYYGEKHLGNYWYYFKKGIGVMATGWTVQSEKPGKQYYYNDRGQMQYGWQAIGNDAYYFDKVYGVMKPYTFKNSNGYWLAYDRNGNLVKDLRSAFNNESSYVIKVNKPMNTVTVYMQYGDGSYTVPLVAFICSTGASTPTGTFYTPDKWRWLRMMGPSWGQWVTQISGDYLFHSVYYNSTNNNNSLSVSAYNNLGKQVSHGCIRLTAGDAKWIYDHCALQTKVIIYSDTSTYGPLGRPTAYKLPSWHTWDPTDPNMYYKCRQRGCH